MSFRLRNQVNPEKTISVSNEAWFSLLEMAEDYGWNPMGTILPEGHGIVGSVTDVFYPGAPSDSEVDYTPEDQRLVMLEDALNLADALERAFLDYEPERSDLVALLHRSRISLSANKVMPGIGAITSVMNLAWQGSFWIERA